MPKYLWAGKSPAGAQSAERVEADDAEQAKAILEAQGWTNLELHKSEIAEFVEKGAAAASNPDYKVNLTPEQELKFQKGENPRFLGQWWNNIVEAKGTIGFTALLLAWSIYRHRLWGTIIFSVILFALLFLFPVLHLWFVAPMKAYQKMHSARTWWRWAEVLQCLDELKRAQGRTKIGIGRADLARYWGLALVGTGLVEQGIAIFTKEAEEAQMPEWMKVSHLAVMYNVAQQFDKALECRRQAVAVSNGDVNASIDLANYLVDPLNFPDEAKALLAKIETKTVPAIGRPYIPLIKGLIAWREGHFKSADSLLRESLRGTEQNANNRYYIFESSILIGKGRLAVVNAALGNKAEAQKFFAESEAYLSTTKRNDLIAEYKKHMAQSAVAQPA